MHAPYQNVNTNKTLSRVLVLDANQRSALAVTRSLGACPDIHVLTADVTASALAGCSKYSQQYFRCPSPDHQPQAFLTWLESLIKTQQIDWVFPVTEISSQLILSESQILGSAKIPFAPLTTVMALADKWELVQLAERVGAPTPSSRHYNNASELLTGQLSELTYPLVLKPCQSRRWLGDRWLNTSVHIAHSELQLRQLLDDKLYLREYPFMAQQYIEGHGAGVFALYSSGKPVTFFAHQRLREKPPQGGVSVLSQSAELDPIALRHTRALLDAVKWHGVAMVEFRIARDGTPYLMEVNTRFWGSLQLAIDSGVDFPALLYRISSGEHIGSLIDYRKGQRLRWLLGDVDSLYLSLRDKNFTLRQKLARILDFLAPHPLSTRHEVNRWGDSAPAWFELKSYIKGLIGKH